MCLKPKLIFLHTTSCLDTLKSPPLGPWGIVEMNQGTSGAEPEIGKPTLHPTLLCTAAILSQPISHFTAEIGYSEVRPGDDAIWGKPKPCSASQFWATSRSSAQVGIEMCIDICLFHYQHSITHVMEKGVAK